MQRVWIDRLAAIHLCGIVAVAVVLSVAGHQIPFDNSHARRSVIPILLTTVTEQSPEALVLDDPSSELADSTQADSDLKCRVENMWLTADTVVELSDYAMEDLHPGSVYRIGASTGPRVALRKIFDRPPQLRWEFDFDHELASTFAAQIELLETNEIELGLLRRNGTIDFLKYVKGEAQIRCLFPVENELSDIIGDYVILKSDSRRIAAEHFSNCGIDISDGVAIHFFIPIGYETKRRFMQLELAYSEKPAPWIRRTRFEFRKTGTGYDPVVASQEYRGEPIQNDSR
jgi:hypothetical protein